MWWASNPLKLIWTRSKSKSNHLNKIWKSVMILLLVFWRSSKRIKIIWRRLVCIRMRRFLDCSRGCRKRRIWLYRRIIRMRIHCISSQRFRLIISRELLNLLKFCVKNQTKPTSSTKVWKCTKKRVKTRVFANQWTTSSNLTLNFFNNWKKKRLT